MPLGYSKCMSCDTNPMSNSNEWNWCDDCVARERVFLGGTACKNVRCPRPLYGQGIVPEYCSVRCAIKADAFSFADSDPL